MDSTIYESFTLPSRGMIYENQISPIVTLRSMTTMEEMKRLSPTDTPYKAMADIIEDCMKDKPDISVYDMCLGDYQFLLHKLRVVTYGTKYSMTISCPNCGQIVDSTVDLDTLNVNEYDDSYSELMSITLPITKKVVVLKFQTPRDLDNIELKKKEMKKKSKLNFDFGLLYSVTSLIKSVDGQVMNSIVLEEFVKKLPMNDVNYILNCGQKLNEKVGVDNSVIAKCPECDYEVVAPFRFTSEFFRPTYN